MLRRNGIFSRVLWILIPMVLALYYNQAANWHLHILQNGMVIEHAHPYHAEKIPGTPYQQHQHNGLEYLALAQISFLAILLLVAAALAALTPAKVLSLNLFSSSVFIEQYHSQGRQLRAPPSFA